MPTERSIKYGRPRPPADINQEYMDVPETAYVLNCGVNTVRRHLKALGLTAKVGRAIVTDKADREAIKAYRSAPPTAPVRAIRRKRVPRQRTTPQQSAA